MKTVRLIPSIKSTIWGGQKLREYGKKTKLSNIAETWELSFHPDGLCKTKYGYLKDIISKEDLGKNCEKFDNFPCMIKFINSNDNLSVQVHPSDEYARINENSNGKSEMWYVLDHEKDAGIYLGFKEEYTKDTIKKALEEGTILELLNFYKVKKGQHYFIPSGTIHAIGKGVTVAEIQENSNITYRLFDYNRVDKNGNHRELHINKALDVINTNKWQNSKKYKNRIGKCKYFTTYIEKNYDTAIISNTNSFVCINILEGSGKVDRFKCKKGDSFFLPANTKCKLTGSFKYLLTTIDK